MNKKTIIWDGNLALEPVNILNDGGIIVSPTKVGYIIITTNQNGLERKFKAKERNLDKPGVVLCGSMEELKSLAQLNEEIERFYQYHWDNDILLGCILPWKPESLKFIPDDGSQELMMDKRQTSCFVIKFGKPSEQIAAHLWQDQNKLCFASSANPSGKGNRGLVEGIGDKIANEVDMIISANDYVRSIQPNVTARYEQGVMVAMVDEAGKLIPEQKNQRGITPAPVIIRKGLDINKIMMALSQHFTTWDYRQGFYY